MRIAGVLVLALTCFELSCDGAPDAIPDPGPTPSPPTAAFVNLRPVWSVSTGEEGPFGFISAAVLGQDGAVYAGDTQARVVHRFDAAGSPAGTIGGLGRGPGEFEAITRMAVSADTIFVWDPVVWRITAFDPAGVLIQTRRVVSRSESGWPVSVGRSADGTWLYLDQEIASLADPGVDVDAAVIRATARLVRWSTEADDWSPVAEFPGTEAALIRDGNGELSLGPSPLPRGPVWTVDGGGGYWYADSDTYRITRHGPDGSVRSTIAVDMAGPASTDADRDSFVSAGARLEPGSEESRRRAAMDMPANRPVLQELMLARTGELWVRVDTGEAPEWHVFDPSGVMLYRLRLPERTDLLFVSGDTLVVVTRDALDVQTVGLMVIGS